MPLHFARIGLKCRQQMNKNLFASVLLAGLASVFLAGCEADRAKPPGVPIAGEVHPLAEERPLSAAEILLRAAAQPPATTGGEGWQPLFDGHSLAGWRVTPFARAGTVECKSGLIVLETGNPFTGINCTNEIPNTNYEVTLEAMRVAGSDLFCGLTFPVGDSFCSFIVGGAGGAVVGLSGLDGLDVSANETTQFIDFETGRWYRVRLRVSEKKIEAWIEQKKVVDVELSGHKIALPGDIELSRPFGLASWRTTAALREIRIRRVDGPESPVE
jgi:Domain of Unknown Function (DUF1080)